MMTSYDDDDDDDGGDDDDDKEEEEEGRIFQSNRLLSKRNCSQTYALMDARISGCMD